MAREEEAEKAMQRGDESNSKSISKKRKSPIDSDTDSYSSSDDNRKRKERKRERKEKKHRRSKKDRKKKRRHTHESSDSDSDEEQHRRHKHKHKKKKTKDHHAKKKELKGTADERVKSLTEEDYFSKNKEFSTWLKDERGIFFSNLSSEKSRMLFLEFASAWNSGRLPSEYYEGISSAPRTDHNWGFKVERKTISEDPVEEREISRKIEKSERKKYQKMQEVVLDELLPKASGRERMLEKKAINREQARAREDSPELMKEKDLMGGSDDFHSRLEKQRVKRQKKEMERSAVLEEKLKASRQKEAAAMSQFQTIINEAGGKITIPKRN